MKCELCHNAEAETAIVRGEGDAAEELYVCSACAKIERQRRQQKVLHTRKQKFPDMPPGVSMSVTHIGPKDGGPDLPPPFVDAMMNAIQGFIADYDRQQKRENQEAEEKYRDFPLNRVDPPYRVGNRLHLEGLHLIGELDAAKRALRALKMELCGVCADGVKDAGHVFSLRYAGSPEQAKRVLGDLLREERNARVRLFEEMPRVFGDSFSRALAIVKNCRLLSPGELYDLLSPLRLAAREDLLEGITFRQIERMQAETDLSSAEDKMDPQDRDRADAARADLMNARFADVVFSERAEEKFL